MSDQRRREFIEQWGDLRHRMIGGVPPAFTRDEWAYLIGFTDPGLLASIVARSLPGSDCVYRPRGPISIWLPNNVSLLGPLVVILATLTGSPIRVKAGSRSEDLCSAFFSYAIGALRVGGLRDYLTANLSIGRFGRDDPRNAEMASTAAVRIAFGSDRAISEIHSLPHRHDSVGIGFGDHRSETWAETAALNETAIRTLIKVFAIYGQAGCTSPRRLVLLNGTREDCEIVRTALLTAWPSVIPRDVPAHIASQNIAYGQLCSANGWSTRLAHRNGAVVATGTIDLPEATGLMTLGVVAGTYEQAADSLPENIQTLGYCMPDVTRLATVAMSTKIKRIVPLARMHHFGPVWDGQNFFRLLFEEVPVET